MNNIILNANFEECFDNQEQTVPVLYDNKHVGIVTAIYKEGSFYFASLELNNDFKNETLENNKVSMSVNYKGVNDD